MRFPRTSAGKNQKLADCVNYTRKRKTRDEVADHYVVALNGIKCEWNKGQSRGCQFDVRFAQLKEFSNTRCTTDSQQPLIRMVFSTMIEMVMNRRMLPSPPLMRKYPSCCRHCILAQSVTLVGYIGCRQCCPVHIKT
jgi:hypothetical protein